MWVMGGGFEAPNPSNEVDVYDPVTNTWSLGPPFVTARRFLAMDTNGTDHIWLVGGYDDQYHTVGLTEVFCSGASSTPTPTATATATATPTSTPTANSYCDAVAYTRRRRLARPSQPIRQRTSRVFPLHSMAQLIRVGRPRLSISSGARQPAMGTPPLRRLRLGIHTGLSLPTSSA